jgi:thiazole synthase
VLGPPPYLYPDMAATYEAAEALLRDGFEVMVYCADDPVGAKRLEAMGCVAIMPLGAPIGSGLGIQNPAMISILIEQAGVPLLVDAGVGTASDAAIAMELGCDAVLLNSAIAHAREPVRMARAMRAAVAAGREAFLAGRMARKMAADPSSPLTGLIRR